MPPTKAQTSQKTFRASFVRKFAARNGSFIPTSCGESAALIPPFFLKDPQRQTIILEECLLDIGRLSLGSDHSFYSVPECTKNAHRRLRAILHRRPQVSQGISAAGISFGRLHRRAYRRSLAMFDRKEIAHPMGLKTLKFYGGGGR